VNATFVSVGQHKEAAGEGRGGGGGPSANRVKLDCRVTGYPAPWIQWFRNGKLLRNRRGRMSIRTSRWKRRHDVRLSRLELELRAGRNETGVYECRAMNVVAREPVVGTYTLLVLPAHYALIPMQPPMASSESQEEAAAAEEQRRRRTQQAGEAAPTATSAHPPSAAVTTSATTPSPPAAAQAPGDAGGRARKPAEPQMEKEKQQQQQQQEGETAQLANSIQESPVVGQPCPREAHDNFCLNKGTCVLIGHIEEYFCK